MTKLWTQIQSMILKRKPNNQVGEVQMRGKVKWFNDRKGYGFIVPENGEDIFVHHTGVTGNGFKTLQEGAEVEFDIGKGKKGPSAVNVRIV